ncbi:DUF4236 domain-containing protein [Variovorax sp. LjRoot130]|uniref:DUF4236 domain-containing protein n=1 Tax=Variovorax sp. LjRoot130 TaxID=3342261 RepID=UPI003ECEB0F1
MSITFSKSVKFGAVRFNFSGSGIGMSAGIPGLRVGTGPRGAYISGGVAGFRYRRSLGARSSKSVSVANGTPQPSAMPGAPQPAPPDRNVVATVRHETVDVLDLSDSTSDGLLASMNEQRSKTAWWPFVAAGFGALVFGLFKGESPQWLLLAACAVAVGSTLWVSWRDRMKKLTVLFYEPDPAATRIFEKLSAGSQQAASARKLKSVTETSQYRDTKYSAGAAHGLKFGGASLLLGQAPGVVANIPVPILKTDRTTLAFFPDRIPAFQGKAVGAIEYKELRADSVATRFIENETVPVDANVVGRTWQYVNKKGGPDKRFKNNRELPICLYNEFNLSTARGLDLKFLGSRDGGFSALADALSAAREGR